MPLLKRYTGFAALLCVPLIFFQVRFMGAEADRHELPYFLPIFSFAWGGCPSSFTY